MLKDPSRSKKSRSNHFGACIPPGENGHQALERHLSPVYTKVLYLTLRTLSQLIKLYPNISHTKYPQYIFEISIHTILFIYILSTISRKIAVFSHQLHRELISNNQ